MATFNPHEKCNDLNWPLLLECELVGLKPWKEDDLVPFSSFYIPDLMFTSLLYRISKEPSRWCIRQNSNHQVKQILHCPQLNTAGKDVKLNTRQRNCNIYCYPQSLERGVNLQGSQDRTVHLSHIHYVMFLLCDELSAYISTLFHCSVWGVNGRGNQSF